jgi:hypothetical protein
VAPWAFLLNSKSFGSLDEVNSIVVMLRHTGGDGKDVDIENDIMSVETNFFDQDFVSSLAYSDFVLGCGCLTLFIKSHDDNSGSVEHDLSGL